MTKKFTDKFEKKSAIDKIKDSKQDSGLTVKSASSKSTSSPDDSSVAKPKGSYQDQLIASSLDRCFKISGKDITGRMAWYFVIIDKDKKDAFLKHKSGDSYNIEDYGKIIISAYGDEVPEDVQEMLKEKYGFDSF